MVLFYIYLLSDRFVCFQDAETVLQGIGEQVAHGDELDMRIGTQRLCSGAGSASAATDQANAEDVTAAGIYRQRGRQARAHDCRRRTFQKTAPRRSRAVTRSF